MDAILVAVNARWENCLSEFLSRRGHVCTIVNDHREFSLPSEPNKFSLAFVGIRDIIDESIAICRRLRAESVPKPLHIFACGEISKPDHLRALCSAGVNDCLTDADDAAELELRLMLAEYRDSITNNFTDIGRPGIEHDNNHTNGTAKGFFRTSVDGKFLDVNQVLVEMLGYNSREELMQIDLSQDLYLDPSIRRQFISEPFTGDRTDEMIFKHHDGHPIALQLNWRRVFDDAGQFLYFEGVAQDISKLKIDSALLKIQFDLALKLSSASDLQTTLDEVLIAVMKLNKFDCSGFYIFNETTRNFELNASLGGSEELAQAVARYSLDPSLTQYMMMGKLLSFTADDHNYPHRDIFEKATLKSVAVIPIAFQGRLIGTLNFGSRDLHAFTSATRQAIEAIAAQISGNVARAQAETTKHINQHNLQSLFDSLQDMIFVLDEKGRLLHTNPMTCKRLGYTYDELSKLTVIELHPSEFRQQATEVFSQILAGKTLLCEIPLMAKDGTLIPVETFIACGKWANLNAIFGVARDLTERHRAKLALKESEALFRGLFENLPDFVILVDANAKIIYTNHDAPERKKEEMVGHEGFGFIAPPYRNKCRKAFIAAFSTGSVQRVEAWDVYGHIWSCSVVPFIEAGVINQLMIICTDITEQKQAAEAVHNEEQLLRRIIDIHERDRQVTAYEIHDSITQQATASLLHLDAFRRLRNSDAVKADESLDVAAKLISHCVNESRRLISGLRPLILDEYGIIEAIEYLICEYTENTGIQITFTHDVNFERLTPPLESAVFRIVQEAVGNACRHSQGDLILVSLVENGDRLRINVGDNGVGFDQNLVQETCFGLRSICERARLLGGHATIDTYPGMGTRINIELPLVLRTSSSLEQNDDDGDEV